MGDIKFTNCKIFAGGAIREGELHVRDGKILPEGNPLSPEAQIVDLGGCTAVPGFIDIHTHGGSGVDVNSADEAGFDRISRFFASNGVTGWLCSVLTDTRETTLKILDTARRAMGSVTGAALLGVHLEGPFLSPEYKGAMPLELLRHGDYELYREYQEASGGNVRYITVAPEVEGVLDAIPKISREIPVAIGHSGADYETAIAAIEAGAASCTHTFNAMGLFHQHRPAIMGAVLERPIYCEAICDGRHLHPGTVRMLLACKGWDKVVAITDSIEAAGLPDGNYKLGINDVVVVNGDALLASTGVRAGSTLTSIEALRNIMRFTGAGLERALPLLTENPAALLGLKTKGRLEPGYDADITVLDGALNVRATYVAGELVYGTWGNL